MKAAKVPLAIAVAVMLIAVPVSSRICDFNCSFYGCALSSPVNPSENDSKLPPCHQHKKHQPAPAHQESPGCAGHFDATALMALSGHTARPLPPVSDAMVVITGPLPLFNLSSEKTAARPCYK